MEQGHLCKITQAKVNFDKVKDAVKTTVGLSIPGIEKRHIKGKLGGVDHTE